MRGRVIAAFAAGFAIGALVLVAALWGVGGLKHGPLPPWQRTLASEPPAPAVPDTSAGAQLPSPPVPPPESLPSPTESQQGSATQQGSADRAATEPATLRPSAELHLAMPIAKIDPQTLTDTFNDQRSGHKHEALDIPAPRGTPVLAVTAFLVFLGGWTEFYLSWQFLTDPNSFTLSMALVIALPVAVVYLSLQKYIVGGLTVGSVKG